MNLAEKETRNKKNLRKQAEARTRKKLHNLDSLTAEDIKKLVNELEVHQVELELQNEELIETRHNLEHARARFQELYDYAPVGYITLDKHNVIKEANITFCQMLDIKRADMLKQKFTDFILPDCQNSFYLHRRAVLREKTSETCEIVLRYPDGQTLDAELESVPDEEGLRCTVRDISGRKKVEAEIRVKDYAISSAISGICMSDSDGRIIYANPAFLRMWGYDKPQDVNGKPMLTFGHDTRPDVPEILSATKAQGTWHGEFSAARKDGSVVEVEVFTNLIEEPGNPHPKIMASFLDISERKKLERIKDEFLSLVSHEVRTPLTIIEGSLKVALKAGDYQKGIRELMVNASEAAGDLGNIFDNMLELTRDRGIAPQLHLQSVELKEIANKVINKLAGHEPGRNFQIEIPDDLANMEADPLRLERILYNLLGNAAKYSTPDREIRLRAEEKEGFVVTHIIDLGVGISPADQETLFQPFRRLGDTTAVKGTGLGLVVCKLLVETQNGWIKVKSKPGHGSTFSFGLPLTKAPG